VGVPPATCLRFAARSACKHPAYQVRSRKTNTSILNFGFLEIFKKEAEGGKERSDWTARLQRGNGYPHRAKRLMGVTMSLPPLLFAVGNYCGFGIRIWKLRVNPL
jgi:hypothetical protein